MAFQLWYVILSIRLTMPDFLLPNRSLSLNQVCFFLVSCLLLLVSVNSQGEEHGAVRIQSKHGPS